jgi:CBS domain containing-hemolysin-like protein
MAIEILIACVLLVALTFLSLVDVAFGELSDVGLRRLIGDAEEEPRGGVSAFLSEILENRSRFRHTLTVSILILVVAISFLVFHAALVTLYQSSSLENLSPSVAHASAFFVALGAAALARQVIPRVVAARRPEATLRRLLPILRPLYRPLSLVAFAWFGKSDRQRRAEQQIESGTETDEDDGDDLQALIDVGEEEGILEEEEGELIQSIIEFGDTRVNEVMTPRTDIVAVAAAATVREVRDLMVESKYSRLPVYREQIDNVDGLVYVRDILQCWVEGREEDAVASLVRPTYFVPVTKPVAELLEEMQKAHVQLAMVIDEYGGVAGLVTVEDILEEIVGEIEDEDTEAEDVVEIVEAGGGYYEVPGSTEVGKIERLFDFEIEDDDFTTIAGLVINELGQVPRPGARLTFRGLDVEVLESDERRISRLRLRRAEEKVAGAE